MKQLYSDNHLFVCEKPAGISTQPDFHELAKAWIKQAFAKPGKVFLEPIHRIDKPASGIVLFARTSKALSRLQKAMRERQLQKIYFAIVEGEVETKGTLVHHLSHGNFRAVLDSKGKESILHYRLLKLEKGNSLIEVQLETGRYHQIRAQFSAIGHPILGDQKYGSKKKLNRIALHHQSLKFSHPVTKSSLTFYSEEDFFDFFEE